MNRICPEGIDIVLDCLSGEITNKDIGLTKPLGKYLLYGTIQRCLSFIELSMSIQFDSFVVLVKALQGIWKQTEETSFSQLQRTGGMSTRFRH